MNKTRLTKSEIHSIKQLVKENQSLNKIVEITGKPKTTIYYYFREIRGKTTKPIVVNDTNSELVGEFIGLFAGDGCLYKADNYTYRIYLTFNTEERRLVNELIKEVLLNLFGKPPMIFIRENRLTLCYYSKRIQQFIHKYLTWDTSSRKTYSVMLKTENLTREFFIGFIRGSIESDGYISKDKISFATVSPGLMKSISRSLHKLKLSHKIRLYKEKRENRKAIYHINLPKKEFDKFFKIIKPRYKRD
jgi:hypothetical protein